MDWIDVKDKQPEKYRIVLLLLRDGTYELGSHSHYAEHVWMNHVFKKPKKEEYIVNAKYWMPLPDEPSKQ